MFRLRTTGCVPEIVARCWLLFTTWLVVILRLLVIYGIKDGLLGLVILTGIWACAALGRETPQQPEASWARRLRDVVGEVFPVRIAALSMGLA